MTDPASERVRQAVDSLYKSHYGKILSTLFSQFRDIPLETMEDIVQDAFAAALTAWAADALPANPGGWVFTVARNKALNRIREEKKRWLRLDQQAELAGDEGMSPAAADLPVKLLFACAHPDLSPKTQVVITLKYVANLKVDAISAALGMNADAVEKMLFRVRKKIREEGMLIPGPVQPLTASRLPTVHKIIYLIFNEGYKPSSGDAAVNEDLCEEALLLAKELLDHQLGDTVTSALYALMLFNAARFSSRTGASGELLDLDRQDRRLWNQPMIQLACDYFRQAREGKMSSYHYEAAIAWLHCTAPGFAETDWPLISRIYLKLLRMNPNPFVELNYAIALYFSGKKAKAFELLHALLQQPFLHPYFLLNATLGKCYLLEGEIARAKEYLSRALTQTTQPREIAFIRQLLDRTS
ncbi:MAG TPA: sigma-70 family RNA polymerase sigma factor [Puia sp.]|nr:sigma-70 family RNA polymerase sigma factor [Puia sp.]